MMHSADIKHAIDRTLSGIDCPARDIRQVLDKAKGEPEMKRKVSISFVVVMILLLLAATALAVGLTRSAKDEAMKTAREALIDTYGHTYETIGVFDEEVTQSGGTWQIVFTPSNFNVEAIGTYTATVQGGKATKLTWSHDNVPPQTYQDANLDADVWGVMQIELALALGKAHEEERYEILRQMSPEEVERLSLEDRAALDQGLLREGRIFMPMNVAPTEEDISEADAVALAKEALRGQYGLTEDALDQYALRVSMFDSGEYRYYMILGSNEDGATFDVKFKSPSGEMLSCAWSIEPELWTLPDGLLDGYEKAVKQYVSSGAFRLLPGEDKADVSERIIAAGYGEYIGNHLYVVPQADDLPEEAAVAAAEEALLDTYGVTQEMLGLFDRTMGIVLEEGRRSWCFGYAAAEVRYWASDFEPRYGVYEVLLDAQSGTAWDVSWTYDDIVPDKAYGKDDWGAAPAWGSDVLPYILVFDAAQRALEAKYAHTQNTLWTQEDFAARDQLFRDAGFVPDEWHYRHGLPGENDISQAQATQIAFDVVKEDYGVTDERLEAMLIAVYFYVDNPDQPVWKIDLFTTTEGIQSWYQVTIEAATGVILQTEFSTGGNG